MQRSSDVTADSSKLDVAVSQTAKQPDKPGSPSKTPMKKPVVVLEKVRVGTSNANKDVAVPSAVGQMIGKAVGKVRQMARILHGGISKLRQKGTNKEAEELATEQLKAHSSTQDEAELGDASSDVPVPPDVTSTAATEGLDEVDDRKGANSDAADVGCQETRQTPAQVSTEDSHLTETLVEGAEVNTKVKTLPKDDPDSGGHEQCTGIQLETNEEFQRKPDIASDGDKFDKMPSETTGEVQNLLKEPKNERGTEYDAESTETAEKTIDGEYVKEVVHKVSDTGNASIATEGTSESVIEESKREEGVTERSGIPAVPGESSEVVGDSSDQQGVRDSHCTGAEVTEPEGSSVAGDSIATECADVDAGSKESTASSAASVKLVTEAVDSATVGTDVQTVRGETVAEPETTTSAQPAKGDDLMARESESGDEKSQIKETVSAKDVRDEPTLQPSSEGGERQQTAQDCSSEEVSLGEDLEPLPSVSLETQHTTKPEDVEPDVTQSISQEVCGDDSKDGSANMLTIEPDTAEVKEDHQEGDQSVGSEEKEETKETSHLSGSSATNSEKTDLSEEVSVTNSKNSETIAMIKLSNDYISKDDLLCQAQLKAVIDDVDKPSMAKELQVSSVPSTSSIEPECEKEQLVEVGGMAVDGENGEKASSSKCIGSPDQPTSREQTREWCAKEVKEGMKIVLRLKRKPSSERDSSVPTTPTGVEDDFPVTDQHAAGLKQSTGEEKQADHRQVFSAPDVSDKEAHSIQDGKLQADAGPAAMKTETPASITDSDSLTVSEWKRRKKKRRSEIELLNETERPKKKKVDATGVVLLPDSGNTGQPAIVATENEPKEETQVPLVAGPGAVEEESVPVSEPEISEPPVGEPVSLEPGEDPAPKAASEERLEKLVIKRRIPSPTKMKTRGKQNRLWYLFAKQSKPSKDMLPLAQAEEQQMRGNMSAMLEQCKPCHVLVVDFIKCLDLMKKQAQSTSWSSDLESTTTTDAPVDATDSMDDVGQGLAVTEIEAPKVEISMRTVNEETTVGQVTTAGGEKSASEGILEGPASKRRKFEPKSDYEKHFLNFIMPEQKKPLPVLDRMARKSEGDVNQVPSLVGLAVQPKPVLTRSPVTARKSIQGGSRRGNIKTVPLKQYPLRGQEDESSVHDGKKESVQAENVTSEHMGMIASRVSFTCGHCGRLFRTRSEVIAHSRQEHPSRLSHIIKSSSAQKDSHVTALDNIKESDADDGAPDQMERVQSDSPLNLAEATVDGGGRASQGHPTPVLSSKGVSLLNPATLTAQVNAARGATPSTSVVATTAAPTSVGTTTSQATPALAESQWAVTSVARDSPTTVFDNGSKRSKVPRRPRIPLLDNVDPNQPYYQCRHCTYASNCLKSIRLHAHRLHMKDQCYQCPLCELAFYKSSIAMAKHYANKHPGEPVLLKLQPDYYDVHQTDLENSRQTIKQWLSNKSIDDSQEGLSPRGQSPLHIIVSPDRITVMGASELSPGTSGFARAANSPHSSPMSAHSGSRGSPAPAHSALQPRPVLSPPLAHQGKAYVSPPMARSLGGGSSGTLSPQGGADGKAAVSRVILKVPTISPPQTRYNPSPASSKDGLPPPSSHPAPSSTGLDVMDLSKSATSGMAGMDLSMKASQARHQSEATGVVSTSETSAPSNLQVAESSTTGVESPLSQGSEDNPNQCEDNVPRVESETQEEILAGPSIEQSLSPCPSAIGKSASPSEYMCKEVSSTCDGETVNPEGTTELSMVESTEEDDSQKDSSPLPLKILNVVSLAGQVEIEGDLNDSFILDKSIVPLDEPQIDVATKLSAFYTCKFCESTKETLDDIISHIGDTHKLRYWYTCPYCPSGCSMHKEQMNKHIRHRHPSEDINIPISITNEEKYFSRPVQPNVKQKSKVGVKGTVTTDVIQETVTWAETESVLDDSVTEGVVLESGAEGTTTGICPEMAEEKSPDQETEPVSSPEEDSTAASLELQVQPSTAPTGTDEQAQEEEASQQTPGDLASEKSKSTSEKSCNTEALAQKSLPQPPGLNTSEDDDIIFMGEQRKVRPAMRPVGQIRPTMVRAPLGIRQVNQQGRGRGIIYRALRPGFPIPARARHQAPVNLNSQRNPILISPDKMQTSLKLDGELDMDCENIDDQPQHDDTVTEDDDVIVTETQSPIISITPMEQPLNLHQSTNKPTEPEDLRLSVRCKSSTPYEPQDLSKVPRPSSTPFQTGLEVPPGTQREQQKMTPTVIQTPPPAHQIGGKQAVMPILIKPLPSSSQFGPGGDGPVGPVAHVIATSQELLNVAVDQNCALPQGPDKQKLQRYVPIAPKPSLAHQAAGPLSKPSGSPVLRQPLPAHSHPGNSGPLRGAAPHQQPAGSAQVPLSAMVGAPLLNTSQASTVSRRPVTKQMPPLIHVLPRSSGAHSMESRVVKPPPPLIRTVPGQNLPEMRAQMSTVASTVRRTAGGGLVDASQQQSALSSLVSMTNRAVPECRSSHEVVVGRTQAETLPKDPELGEAEDEEEAKKMFNVFNLAPRMRQPRPVAPATTHQPPVHPTRGPAGAPGQGLDKWRQFQSQQRPFMHGRPLYNMSTPNPPMVPSGTVGMAAAAFQQAHMRRGPPRVARPPYGLHTPATTVRAAASFMPRHTATTCTVTSSAIPPQPRTVAPSPADATTSIDCPYCQFQAQDADTIHDHILSHAPNIQWTCPYCPLPNRMTKSTVTKHIQNCHPTFNIVHIPYGVPLH